MAKQTLKLGEHETDYESLSEDEARKIVGEELDTRLSALEIPEALDTDALKKDILDQMEGKFTELFEKNRTDEDALVKKLEKSFDTTLGKALKGLGGNGSTERKPGWLTRALFS